MSKVTGFYSKLASIINRKNIPTELRLYEQKSLAQTGIYSCFENEHHSIYLTAVIDDIRGEYIIVLTEDKEDNDTNVLCIFPDGEISVYDNREPLFEFLKINSILDNV